MNSDTATVVINRPADDVFDFMSDPARLDLWSFGTWQIEVQDDGLVIGRSIHNGQVNYVRIKAYPEQQLIDYLVGPAAESLAPRIFARIVSGQVFAADADQSMLIVVAVRTDGMDSARWDGLKTAHAFEVGLIKSLLESGYDHRGGQL